MFVLFSLRDRGDGLHHGVGGQTLAVLRERWVMSIVIIAIIAFMTIMTIIIIIVITIIITSSIQLDGLYHRVRL